jgi:hypothetical protein
MHHLHFEECLKRLESLSSASYFLLNIFMYLSDPLWKKKVFEFNHVIIVGIYLLKHAKFNGKYDTRYFQSLIK